MWSDTHGCKETAVWNVSSEKNGTRTSCDGHLAHMCAKDINTITPVNYPTTETRPEPTASDRLLTYLEGLPVTTGYTSEPERSNGGSGYGAHIVWASVFNQLHNQTIFRGKGGTGASREPEISHRSEPGEPVCACGTNCRRP